MLASSGQTAVNLVVVSPNLGRVTNPNIVGDELLPTPARVRCIHEVLISVQKIAPINLGVHNHMGMMKIVHDCEQIG